MYLAGPSCRCGRRGSERFRDVLKCTLLPESQSMSLLAHQILITGAVEKDSSDNLFL